MSAQLFLFSPNLGASHAKSLGSENGGMKDAFEMSGCFSFQKPRMWYPPWLLYPFLLMVSFLQGCLNTRK